MGDGCAQCADRHLWANHSGIIDLSLRRDGRSKLKEQVRRLLTPVTASLSLNTVGCMYVVNINHRHRHFTPPLHDVDETRHGVNIRVTSCERCTHLDTLQIYVPEIISRFAVVTFLTYLANPNDQYLSVRNQYYVEYRLFAIISRKLNEKSILPTRVK